MSGGAVPPVDTTLPPVDTTTQPWWEATRSGRLLLQSCSSCGGLQFYPRMLCTRCGAVEGLGWSEASGAAVVDTWTVVYRAPVPGLRAPYVLARVRLAEGPLMLTCLIDAPVDQQLDGRAARLAWRPLADGRKLPVFTVAAALPRTDEDSTEHDSTGR